MHRTKKTTLAGIAAIAVIGGSAFAAPLLASADDAGRTQARHGEAEPGDDHSHPGNHDEPGDDHGRHEQRQ